MSEILSYLAGCLDSDGYFGIKKSTYNQRVLKDSKNPSYQEKIQLKQVYETVPKLLQEVFGGSYYKEKPSTKNGRVLYVWNVSNKQAADAARKLLPFLRLKKKQASLLLAIRSSKQKNRQTRGRPLDPSVIDLRESCRLQIKELNKIGTTDLNGSNLQAAKEVDQ